jgi:hypothetical protein
MIEGLSIYDGLFLIWTEKRQEKNQRPKCKDLSEMILQGDRIIVAATFDPSKHG